MYAFFFHPCFMCTLASRLDEFFCGSFCCCTIFDIPMRTKLRTQYGIQVRTGWYAWVSYWLYLLHFSHEWVIDWFSFLARINYYCFYVLHKSVIYRLVSFHAGIIVIDCIIISLMKQLLIAFFMLSWSNYWYWLFLFLAWDLSEFVLFPGIDPGRLLHDHVL